MVQAATWSVPLVGPATPTVMATRMDDSLDAILSAHKGPARPSYAVAGTIWVEDDVTPWNVWMYDGTDDVRLGTLNATTNVFAASVSATAGAWGHITSSTPSAVASVDFINLGAYRMLRLSGHLLPATDAVDLMIRTDASNGASFEATAGDYNYNWVRGSGTTASASENVNATGVVISPSNVGSLSTRGISFSITVANFNAGSYAFFSGTVHSLNTAGEAISAAVGGRRTSGTAGRNAIQLIFSTGNIASGFVTLEGVVG